MYTEQVRVDIYQKISINSFLTLITDGNW